MARRRLIEGTSTVKGVGNMVLAKAGIKPPMGYETNEDQSTYIASLFFERGADTRITMDVHTSIREMIKFNADLVLKKRDQLLNMEYDLKRRPYAVGEVELSVDGRDHRHLVFGTAPWRSVSDFLLARGLFDRFIRPVQVSAPNTSSKAKRSRRRPIKTLEAYRQYVEVADTQALMPVGKDRYMSKRNNADIRRLKRDLCRTFKQGPAGLAAYSALTANEFASILNDCGFAHLGQSVSRADVENGKLSRAVFEPGTSPGINDVNDIVARLTERLPEFDAAQIIGQGQSMTLLTPSLTQSCPFLHRAVTEACD